MSNPEYTPEAHALLVALAQDVMNMNHGEKEYASRAFLASQRESVERPLKKRCHCGAFHINGPDCPPPKPQERSAETPADEEHMDLDEAIRTVRALRADRDRMESRWKTAGSDLQTVMAERDELQRRIEKAKKWCKPNRFETIQRILTGEERP